MSEEKVIKKTKKVQEEKTAIASDEKKIVKTPTKKKSNADKKKIKTLEKKIKELDDRYLRLYSEFDNFRRRTAKERLELNKVASADIIIDILPVLDDIERALNSFNEDIEEQKILKQGVEMVYRKLFTTLEKKGLKVITSVGNDFNTDIHEALTQIKVGKKDKGKVVEEIEKAYCLHDKVIRFAKVIVGN